ncbi:hypothetical protein ACUN90_19185, partial [Escherichia sp. SP-MK2]
RDAENERGGKRRPGDRQIKDQYKEWMAELGKRSSVAVSWIGKVKTTAQMVALAWLLWRPNIWVEYAGIALFFVAAVLTLWSMLQYLSAARTDLLDQ